MLINSDITLYTYDKDTGYTRHYIEEAFWQNTKRTNVLKSGIQNADAVFIAIHYNENEPLDLTGSHHIAVKGDQSFTFDNTSESTWTKSLKELKALADIHEVNSFEPKLYGSKRMWHYELSCK